MFLLDTNVVSELRKPRPHGGVMAWYRLHPISKLFLPSIAFYEMQAGIELTRFQNATKAEEINRWLDEAERRFQILPLNSSSARLAASWMNGRTAELTEDAMIAAIAFTHGMTVATRNTKDFAHFPVATINPFLTK